RTVQPEQKDREIVEARANVEQRAVEGKLPERNAVLETAEDALTKPGRDAPDELVPEVAGDHAPSPGQGCARHILFHCRWARNMLTGAPPDLRRARCPSLKRKRGRPRLRFRLGKGRETRQARRIARGPDELQTALVPRVALVRILFLLEVKALELGQ